jgi:hypothetical protein
MSTIETKRKTVFLNGVEVQTSEPTGDSAQDLAAAQRFLAEQGINPPSERLTWRVKIARMADRFLRSRGEK